jgi:hypothetical protein
MKTKLIALGVDGGGFTVFEMEDKTIEETGNSGGILDNDDPLKSWNKKFNTLEDWWLYFTTTQGNYWICFSISYVDKSIKEFVLQKVNEYDSTYFGDDYHKNNWIDSLKFCKS